MKFKYVSAPHPLISFGENKQSTDKLLPLSARYFLRKWDYPEADKALIAFDANDKIIGFMRYTHTTILFASGTWVDLSYRKSGLAFKLWKKVLTKEQPEKIYVYTTSKGGKNLIFKIKKVFNKIDFDHCYDY